MRIYCPTELPPRIPHKLLFLNLVLAGRTFAGDLSAYLKRVINAPLAQKILPQKYTLLFNYITPSARALIVL